MGSQGLGPVSAGRQWSQDSASTRSPHPLTSAMCQPTHWSWHRGKAICARKQVWCRLFPCWSNEEAIETLGVAIWLLTPFLLQCNHALLPVGAGLSAGPPSSPRRGERQEQHRWCSKSEGDFPRL